ncbi:MAG: helix-turn-helix transcriptional regulator [Oscillospiraceae bacterium]
MYFYERIRNLREDHDLTQTDVAKLLHTTQQVYSEYENGVREIPLFKIIILAKYYKVSLDYITGLSNEKN